MSRALAVVACLGAPLAAQLERVVPGQAQVRVLGAIAGQDPVDDPGTTVEMFENPNLDRYLRRAQELLADDNFSRAIEILQDVIEGRTVEVVALRPEEGAEPGAQPAEPDAQPRPGEPPADVQTDRDGAGRGAGPTELDARNSVFSTDGRLYRPVRRLCHELLARLPEVGIQIYRTAYEVEAERMLAEAQASGSTNDLERIANRFFVTLPAGRAMVQLADRLMHEGRYRAAVQVLRDLLEVYPADNRRSIGVRDVWCRFKIALCLRLAGEREAAVQEVAGLAERHPEESLRIMGQLESIADLPSSELFARDTVAIEEGPSRGRALDVLTRDTDELVPLWQFRFAEPEPYKDPKPSKNRTRNMFESQRSTRMPFANRYGPATWVAFSRERDGGHVEPRALFLEHFRLRMTDAATGLILREGDGEVEPPVVRDNHPRVRIAAVDYALLRPVEDAERRYCVIGHEGNTTQTPKPLASTELVAYRRDGWDRAWSSQDWLEGEDGLRDVTFLAAPTIFGERLLLPSLRDDAYTLECLDRATGRPLWHTPLHAGGSPFFKAPGCPVAVLGSTAYVATNAGCVAAVDAFAGDLRWIRRYERTDTIHKQLSRKQTSTTRGRGNYYAQFTQEALSSFLPTDLILHEGLLVMAPCDGDVLLAIDTASGEPVWMLDGNTRYAPYGRLIDVVGHDGELMYATSETHLVCIELDGGLVRWQQKLPAWSGPRNSGRGRGVVLDSVVVIPNMRELLLFDRDNEQPVRRLQLPAFDEGREPLQGSCNVVVEGPWLAVGYQGGVEIYSSRPALTGLAAVTEDPLRRAHYLTRAGDTAAAEQSLAATIRAASDDPDTRERASSQLLKLVRRRALELAGGGDLEAALREMDAVRELCTDRAVRLDWHLARIELCKHAGDPATHSVEQERLYAYMEGRG